MPAVTRPVLPPLQTPKTASFPSEIINTPVSCISAMIKQEDVGTPITPPVAYTEFLKALTPVLASPPETGALQRSMSDESTCTRESIASTVSTTSSTENLSKTDNQKPSPSSVPPTPYSRKNPKNLSKTDNQKPSPSSVPPTPYSRKNPSALRRLRIPHSPAFSPSTCGPSPRTAISGMSSGSMLYSPFSPADWNLDSSTRRYFDTPKSACPKPVSVRSVVTRTVTYKRSPPLDPAPKGKKRKVEDPEMPPPPTTRDAGTVAVATFPSTLIATSSAVDDPSSTLPAPSPTAVSPPTAVA
ncbi:hypothetical protein HRR88_001591 [Exophiala dermatitidis]|nr:hypothetical protein HRR88_001591 [Exophiala dermatitidis]